MKKFGQLLKDLGFNRHASRAAQEAFLRHLQRSAQLENVRTPPAPESKEEQLIFDAEILGRCRKTK